MTVLRSVERSGTFQLGDLWVRRLGYGAMILHGTDDKAAKSSGSELFYDRAGSTDKTLKLYDGYFHDLLNDLGKDTVITDIISWIDARSHAA